MGVSIYLAIAIYLLLSCTYICTPCGPLNPSLLSYLSGGDPPGVLTQTGRDVVMMAKIVRQLINDLQDNTAWKMGVLSAGKPSRVNLEKATTPSTETTTYLHPLATRNAKTLRVDQIAEFHQSRT